MYVVEFLAFSAKYTYKKDEFTFYRKSVNKLWVKMNEFV